MEKSMMKIGVGWAAGVLTGALAVGGITAAAIQVSNNDDACAKASTSSASALGCVSADKTASAAGNAANSASKAALASAQSQLKTATASLGKTDATKALSTASGLLDTGGVLAGTGVAGNAASDAQKQLESTLAKQLGIVTSTLNSAQKLVADFQSGKINATDLAKQYKVLAAQLKTAKKQIDLVFSTASDAMKLVAKQNSALAPINSQYQALLKTAKSQFNSLYGTATKEFGGAFGTVSNALSITNGVAGLPAIPGAGDALKTLPVGDPLKTVTDLTKGLPTSDVTKVVEDVQKNLPVDLGKTLESVPVVGGTVGGLLNGTTGGLLGGL
ncbi:MAG: hypothetical protein ACT4QF_13980 [Sporichthyaceae bacterium]